MWNSVMSRIEGLPAAYYAEIISGRMIDVLEVDWLFTYAPHHSGFYSQKQATQYVL